MAGYPSTPIPKLMSVYGWVAPDTASTSMLTSPPSALVGFFESISRAINNS